MLNVTFDTTTHKLSVVDQTTTVTLALDTYSDPTITSGSTSYGRPDFTATSFGTYDTAKPWSVLQDKEFSRRLGWNPGSTTLQADIQTAYGADAGIWIEVTSQSTGLETYQAKGKFGVGGGTTAEPYVDSNGEAIVYAAAGGYTPIFGTSGSSTKWKWDYKMDHNVYAISSAYLSSSAQTLSADYRVYIGDSSGNDLDAAAASAETWTWQTSPVPEPASALAVVGFSAATMLRRRKAV